MPTITGELKRYFRDKTWAVHVPPDPQELGLKVQRMAERMTVDLGRGPTVSEPTDALAVSKESVLEARQALDAYRASSIDVPRAGDEDADETLADKLGVDDGGFGQAREARDDRCPAPAPHT